MNRRTSLLRVLVLCTASVVAACAPTKGAGLGGAVPGSGNLQTETRDTGAFEAVAFEYPADILIQQGEKDTVVIEAEDNLLQQLSSEVSSGKLTIKTLVTDWKLRVNPSMPVKITITMKNPKEIEFAAPVGTVAANGLRTDTLKLVLSGAGQVKMRGIEVDLLDGVLSGAGDIQVAGTADKVDLTLSGMGNFNAADLHCDTATVELSGTGDATVRVETELTAAISGSGSVNYFGTPRVEQKVTGLGAVQPAKQGD